MIDINDIIAANKRIKAVPDLVYETPLSQCRILSDRTGADVWLKCEHLQQTGSFKLRGAANKILSLSEAEKKKGVITASTGNHGMGVALDARFSGVKTQVFVPENASEIKLEAIRAFGADIVKVPGDALQAELAASRKAQVSGIPFISPYNDPDVVAGQGSVGLEILEKGRDVDHVFVSVGGGGLISGIGSCLKQSAPHIRIHGCWPENAPAMYQCLEKVPSLMYRKLKPCPTAQPVVWRQAPSPFPSAGR